MNGYTRFAIVATPLALWGVVLLALPRVWAPTPRMTGGLGPPFAAVGTLAIVFASALLAVAAFHPRRRVAYPSGVLGVGVALVYLVLALRL